MPPDTLRDDDALNLLALSLDNRLLPTRDLIGTPAGCCGARQADPLLTLVVDKDDLVFPSAEQVAYDQVMRVSVEGLTAFV